MLMKSVVAREDVLIEKETHGPILKYIIDKEMLHLFVKYRLLVRSYMRISI